MERDVVAPVRISLKIVVIAPYRPASATRRIAPENVDQSACQVLRGFAQREQVAGTGRTFHCERLPVIAREFLQGTYQHVVNREPDRPAPIRVATEQTALRFFRHVPDAQLPPARCT